MQPHTSPVSPSIVQQAVQELYGLMVALHALGRDIPDALLYLTQVVLPDLPAESRVPTLGTMFEQLPALFQKLQPNQLSEFARVLQDPPADAVHLRLLLQFGDLAHLLSQISFLQLLHLSNNVIPPGPLENQVRFLSKLQELFQSRDKETLLSHHNVLSETPLHMEVQQLLELERGLPFELIYIYGELLKLPQEELFSLQDWLSALSATRTNFLVKLLLLDAAVIVELKQRLGFHAPVSLYPPPTISVVPPIPVTPPVLPSPSATFSANSPLGGTGLIQRSSLFPMGGDPLSFKLRVARQPPAKTVYQRILKPFPSVMLVSGNDTGCNLFVEVILIRSDSEQELPLTLEGNRVVRISNGIFATFKKLKILSTSQMQGTLFRLKFLLKRYVGTVFELIPSASVISDPVEVFSHTLYLNTPRADIPPPPSTTEILPPVGSVMGGQRIVILGARFLNNPLLRVRFGDVEVVPVFHEAGTLIVQTPPHPPATVPVRVANDGKHFCETKVVFTFT